MIGRAFSNTALGPHGRDRLYFFQRRTRLFSVHGHHHAHVIELLGRPLQMGILVIARYLLRWICAYRTVAGISIDREAR
jgi:hypothetical protein